MLSPNNSAQKKIKRILVTGSSGFIGHHLVNYLKNKGYWVRGADLKKPDYLTNCDEFCLLDLRRFENCLKATKEIDEVYALAADMGGMGFIQDKKNQAPILRNNALININTAEACKINKVNKVLFGSSACVYPICKQNTPRAKPLKEEDVYPANPQDTYGWEKLISEILYTSYKESYRFGVRIVRFHNIYGPEETYHGGREKVTAALCRKVIEAKKNNKRFIEIWGDGKQTRSFCYIDDCLKGLKLVMDGDFCKPVNLGRTDMISINQLADLICKIGKVKLKYRHVDGPVGVRGRNSDNVLFKKLYDWEPQVNLKEGLKKTYLWIERQLT